MHDFWDQNACGEELYLATHSAESYSSQAEVRYRLEPYIFSFAEFDKFKQKEVLEIGVGLGADHEQFVRSGAIAHGVDLTVRAIEHTRRRLGYCGLSSDLRVCDVEHLPFDNDSMDLVYSWGVIHHAADPARAIAEVYRVLRPGGDVRIMLYQKHSVVGWMLWARYGLLRLRPFMSFSEVYAQFLESPGTKAFTPEEVERLFARFDRVAIDIELTHGDLLTSPVGQRHRGIILAVARWLWPRWLLRRFFRRFGLFLLIRAHKPSDR